MGGPAGYRGETHLAQERIDQHHPPLALVTTTPSGKDSMMVRMRLFSVSRSDRVRVSSAPSFGRPGQTHSFSRAIDDDAQLIGLERFGDEVVSPPLHGRDGGLDGGETGDDDNQYPLIL